MSRDLVLDPLQELCPQIDGELAWEMIAKVEVALAKFVLHGPTARTRTAVAAFSHRVKALERWLVRAADTLRHKEAANGHNHPSHRPARLRNGSPVTQGPQTLGELVLEKCGPDSDGWAQFQRLNRLFGVSTPEELERAKQRENDLLNRYAGKVAQEGQSAST